MRIKQDKWLQSLEQKIKVYVIDYLEKLPENEKDIISYLSNMFESDIKIDFELEELEVLIILVLKQIEESMYE